MRDQPDRLASRENDHTQLRTTRMTRLVVTTPSTLTQEGELRLCEEIASLLDALQVPAVVAPELRLGEPDLGHPALRAIRARWRLSR